MVLVISLMLNKVIFKFSFILSVMFSLISSRLLKAEKLIGTGKLWTIPQKYLLNASAMYVSIIVFQSPINLKNKGCIVTKTLCYHKRLWYQIDIKGWYLKLK